ncbi:hypothetical protein Kpol_1043p39 [Vanderwaltozyma polyspora DSM 70294]|uniref:Transcription factor IIIC subunit 5 HTH domain-containing protein n=1 Tax=Vanderwaltozyma polyspora (strain ATCC 22028 / DSM 70294 / BCRC 21397 / CBS 2163 / NBRC 10782 / NRRL Y-8283 / UCD 57-17) TaxID=436907 RepID=A7TIQ7_VANPO|nr:uncharacterized protein Kpol_1043p39 [Vanderwaltozyma polyspora DSM 70294]EDO17849.1 hypothetical protein Kpol_1043p39 [Vanderwaltozyma polyspora DSM 70294]
MSEVEQEADLQHSNESEQNGNTIYSHPSELAKEYTLDIPRVPSIEFPLHVSSSPSSINKAINMVGGIDKVRQVLGEHGSSQKQLEMYLNEGHDNDGSDTFFNEHSIVGKEVPFRDESIVLKITVPKGTMAKYNGNVREALAMLKPKQSAIVPVVIINSTIKFREMSDFQIRLDNVPSANEFKDSFGSLDWKNFKNFVNSVPDNDPRPFENINNIRLDRSSPFPNTDYQLPPPPRFSMVSYPFLYKYKTNPFATKKSDGASEVKGSYIKNYQLLVHDLNESVVIPVQADSQLMVDYNEAVKTGIYPGTKKESKFYESLEECLSIINKLFEKRPIWVKRHIDGIVPKHVHHTLKVALALVSYRFTMGPWRNTYIKFGIDPRSSSEYAKYQTEYFKIERKLLRSPNIAKNVPKPPASVFESDVPEGIDTRFKFNGKQIPWYLMLQIDLLFDEPNIAEVYSKVEYLDKANELTGWFKELDLAKIRRIVKYELGCMVQGNYEFNVYKLKYFKTMLYAKESMMNNAKDNDESTTSSINGSEMSTDTTSTNTTEDASNGNAGEVDSDNDITTGEADEQVLENEEAENDPNVSVNPAEDDYMMDEDEDEDNEGDFDTKTASFQDIIGRIRNMNPETADRLSKELEGFINEANL